ncbi:PTS glucitol/sorbitol transporter subunit IIA [Yokenella regensburgei]|uniref:PTS glucitol/sorbitol transporter subunit IIA n=1 Tax=Yokenella regensburgei TaxID=158877 RepID=UPI003EDA93A4
MQLYRALIRKPGTYVEHWLSRGILRQHHRAYALPLESTFRDERQAFGPGDALRLGHRLFLITAPGCRARESLLSTRLLVMCFDHALTPLNDATLHLDGPAPNMRDLQGDFTIEEGYPWN